MGGGGGIQEVMNSMLFEFLVMCETENLKSVKTHFHHVRKLNPFGETVILSVFAVKQS